MTINNSSETLYSLPFPLGVPPCAHLWVDSPARAVPAPVPVLVPGHLEAAGTAVAVVDAGTAGSVAAAGVEMGVVVGTRGCTAAAAAPPEESCSH